MEVYTATFSEGQRIQIFVTDEPPRENLNEDRAQVIKRLRDIKQYFTFSPSRLKAMDIICNTVTRGRICFFHESGDWIYTMHRFLNQRSRRAVCLASYMSSELRKQSLAAFRTGEVRVMLATDEMATMIDKSIPVAVVVQFGNVDGSDFPDYERYLARVARAGRPGVPGVAITLTRKGYGLFCVQEYERHFRTKIEHLSIVP